MLLIVLKESNKLHEFHDKRSYVNFGNMMIFAIFVITLFSKMLHKIDVVEQ